MSEGLTIVSMGRHGRLGEILTAVLADVPFCTVTVQELENTDLTGKRILFALSVDETGIELDYYACLKYLRLHGEALAGCRGGVLIDGMSEWYTKDLARTLVFTANCAGCAFMGRPLVEATRLLQNFDVLSGIHGIDRYSAYQKVAADLVRRLREDAPRAHGNPAILMLHASNQASSNTLALGRQVAKRLEGKCRVNELSMHSAAIYDCNGCAYKACVHYAQQETCFYGGILPESVFPAILESDALMLLCPNYNDAPGAHFLALINRLNSIVLRGGDLDKTLFCVVVSGYSGGDLVAKQILGGMNLNKPFRLPPRFALLETANDPGSAMGKPGIQARLDQYANQIMGTMLEETRT
jgi:multimeric flavodoxin WrbA